MATEKTVKVLYEVGENIPTVSSQVEKWYGQSPDDLQKGITSKDLPQLDIDNLIDKEIAVLGFQNRSGNIKGKESKYILMLCVPVETKQVGIIMTGAGVVMRKVKDIAENGTFPVRAIIRYNKTKKYYDLGN